MKFRKLIVLILLMNVLVILTNSLFAIERIPGNLIIWLNEDLRDEDVEVFTSRYAEYSLEVNRVLSPRFNIFLFGFDPDSVDDELLLELVRKDDSVKLAQFNHKVEERETIPNDSLFDLQWALKNTGQNGGTVGADISATFAWDHSTGGSTQTGREIVIAVIDSGFDLNHPDINWWKNENEIPGNGIDDDGNGYIDDYHGWNAYNNSGVLPVTNHGTHVSGIVGAIANNSIGVAGTGWNIKVMPIAGSSSTEATVVAAYDYALENRILYNQTNGSIGAYVVATNSSFGVNYGDPADYPIWGEMYNLKGAAGILATAATMNINANVDEVGDVPATFPSPYIIAITNTTRYDLKSGGAAYGANSIDLGAPGTAIRSTTSGQGYGDNTGTSMAAPHVAATIGLMYAAASPSLLNHYQYSPGTLALIMKQLLLDGVDVIPALEDITVTGGRLNAHQAVLNIINQYQVNSLPFIEDWTSGNFIENGWIGEGNWSVEPYGNPGPSARFYYYPTQTNYSNTLASWYLDGTGIEGVNAKFSIYLNNYSSDTLEQLSFQVFSGLSWHTIATFNNVTGNIPWTTVSYDITPFARNREFRVRFRAHGQNSLNINNWYIDNIEINIAPLQIPFVEDWSSGDFTDNYWSFEPNWSISTAFGNPGPSARFYYSPTLTNYSRVLGSWEFNGTGLSQVYANFDYYLSDFSTSTVEELSFDVFNGTTWVTVATYNNQGGFIPWTTAGYDISAHASNRVFKIRFRAHGVNSYNITYWNIDNITIGPEPLNLPFTETWNSGSFDTNYWANLYDRWEIYDMGGISGNVALFAWYPDTHDYSRNLTSWLIDATDYEIVTVAFDMEFLNYIPTGNEHLAFEVYSWSGWQEIASWSNVIDLPITTYSYNIGDHVGNSKFRIRFRAFGENSYNISYWFIDNIDIIGTNPPIIAVNPGSLSETLPPTMPVTLPLTITNTGGLDLEYSIYILQQPGTTRDLVPYRTAERPADWVHNPEASERAPLSDHTARNRSLPNESSDLNRGSIEDSVESSERTRMLHPTVQTYQEFTRALFDLIYYFPVGVGEGEYGVVTDGNYIYTAKWNGNAFYRYSLDGTYIGEFTITGFTGHLRDMTYDGQYFYGSPLSSVIYILDLANETLIGQISTSVSNIRGIAYDAFNDGFWVTNGWEGPLRLINRAGATVQTIDTAVYPMSGLAWDNETPSGPYLWALKHTGSYYNVLTQINMTTGVAIQTFDIGTYGIISDPWNHSGGGLNITDQLVLGKWTFLGMAQNDLIYVLELKEEPTWLSVSPITGTVSGGMSANVNVILDPRDLDPDTYTANIAIVHNAPVDNVIVPVEMTVYTPDPLEIPFTEDWSSGSFAANYWSAESNWLVEPGWGNPAPTASFIWYPVHYDYNLNLRSWEIDATGIYGVNAHFDYSFSSWSQTTLEQLSFEVYDGTSWHTIVTFDNQEGNVLWTTVNYDISQYANNRIFKIRFRAHGEYSYNINYWHVDNIVIDASDPIALFPYFEDFETGPKGWTTGAISGADHWELGTPDQTNINSAHSGTNAWMTRLSADYDNNANTWLMSPEFDFSGINNPIISLWLNIYCEARYDAMILESSIDGGITWQHVIGDDGFYNSNSTLGPIPPPKWTGLLGVWTQFESFLPVLGNEDTVLLRFRFGSDPSITSEGIALDDVHVWDYMGPLVSVSPTEISEIVQQGDMLTVPLTITNDGTEDLDYLVVVTTTRNDERTIRELPERRDGQLSDRSMPEKQDVKSLLSSYERSIEQVRTEQLSTDASSLRFVETQAGTGFTHTEHYPESSRDPGWNYLFTGTWGVSPPTSAIGVASPGVWYGGVILDLSDDIGHYITKVGYYDYNATTSVRAQVYVGDYVAPLALISQSLPYIPTGAGYVELDLIEAIQIAGDAIYWIVMEIYDLGMGVYPMGTISPALPNAGKLCGGDPLIVSWTNLIDLTYDYSWLLAAYVEELDNWLTVTPLVGTVLPGQSVVLNVNLDATELDLGVYNANIAISHNAPGSSKIVPVELTVYTANPFTLPFSEDWTSGNFAAKQWTAEGNWLVYDGWGNPPDTPAALFYYSPTHLNYSLNLVSWELDATGLNNINAQFDYFFSSYSQITLEQLSFEVFDGTTWQTITTFNNQAGSIPWTTVDYDISQYASESNFQIRFRAHGEDSYNINYWVIDNILINGVLDDLNPPENLTVNIIGNNIVLNWDEVIGANSYYVYASEDPYAEDWGLPIAHVGLTEYSETLEGLRFFRVIASSDLPPVLRSITPILTTPSPRRRSIRE